MRYHIISGFALTAYIAYKYFYKKKAKKRREINDVIIFSNKHTGYKPNKYLKEHSNENLERLLTYLNSTRDSLDICMYVLTNTEITNAILRQHLRGNNVRVILDADMAFSTGSTIKRLEKHGIPIRWMKSTDIMHNKFCIVDAMGKNDSTPFVMTGSLNWTNQALYRNWENLLITSQENIVCFYRMEFERLWNEFKPIVRLGR